MFKNFFLILIFCFITLSAYSSADDYDEYFQEYFKANNIPEVLQKNFKYCAYNFFYSGDYKEAIRYCTNLLDQSIDYYGPEDENVLELYFYLGQIYYYSQDLKKSKEYILYALPLTEKLYPDNIYNIILGNYVLSIVYTQTGDIEKAIEKLEYLLELHYTDLYYEEFITVYGELPKSQIEINILNSILQSYTNNYNFEKTEKLISRLNELIEENKDQITDFELIHFYNNVGMNYHRKFDAISALEYFNNALNLLNSIVEFDVSFHPSLWNNISLVYTLIGKHNESIELLLNAEKKIISELDSKSSGLFQIYHNLGNNYMEMGKFNNANKYFNKALEIAEFNSDFPEIGKIQTLLNLGANYVRSFELNNAKKIDQKIVKLLKEEYTTLNLDYKNFKAELFILEGNIQEASNIYKQTAAEVTAIYGLNNMKTGDQYYRLSSFFGNNLDYKNAIKYGETALSIYDSLNKINSFYYAEQSLNLSLAYGQLFINSDFKELDNLKKSEKHLQYIENLYQNETESPIYISAKNIRSFIHHYSGDHIKVYENDKRLLSLITNKITNFQELDHNLITQSQLQAQYSSILTEMVGRGIDIFDNNLITSYEFKNHLFKIAQLINANKIDKSLVKMSARLNTKNKDLNDLIYKKEQNTLIINELSADLNSFKTLDVSIRKLDQEEKLLNKLNEIKNENEKLNNLIYNDFPEFSEISKYSILELENVFNILSDDEALVYFLSDFSASVIFMIDKDNLWINRISMTDKDIELITDKIKESVDLNKISSFKKIKKFPIDESEYLYSQLFGKFDSSLKNKKHLFIVPTGKFHSLPFATLITNKINSENYNEISWLINSHSLSMLPSITSLRLFRELNKENDFTNISTFVGIGNPKFNNNNNNLAELEISFNQIFSKGGLADVALINDFSELPETEEELKLMSLNFDENNRTILTREDANETQIKKMDLSNSDVIVFSTHAVINGEIENDEPGLILSPPPVATEENDGILTMSEILQLKLNADFVILSACNTASGENNYSEPLSGLARAFFFAGAKSMLVSNWAVESQSTFELTTTMFDNLREKDTTRSEALQNSMRALINSEENEYYSHPVFWAPFILIGDR